MAPHTCTHEEEIDELKKLVSSLGSKVGGLLVVSGIFIFLVGISGVQATKARDASEASNVRIEKIVSRVDVQEERLKWILEGIQRIEKKLEKKP